MYPSESVENAYLSQNPTTRSNPVGGYELDDGAIAPEEEDESMKLLETMTRDIEKPVSLTQKETVQILCVIQYMLYLSQVMSYHNHTHTHTVHPVAMPGCSLCSMTTN